MNRNIYLLKYRMSGIKNIVEPIEMDFYKKTIDNNFNPDKYKVKAVYGENGSGKTAVILSVKILQKLLLDKNYLGDTNTQKKLSHIINKNSKKGFIEVEFLDDYGFGKKIIYYYVEFALKVDGRVYITSEKMKVKNGNYSKNKYNMVFETKNGELIYFFDEKNTKLYKEKTQNLMDKQTFASAYVYIGQSLDKTENDIIMLSPLIFGLNLSVYIDDEDDYTPYMVTEQLKELEETDIALKEEKKIEIIKKYIRNSKLKDKAVPKQAFDRYEKYINRMGEFIKIFKPDLKWIEIEKKENVDYYECSLNLIYDNYKLNAEFESRGIKKLMELYKYLNAASDGSIVFIDELDSNINDVYLDKLIEYFVFYGKGQLCFTAHNLSPMNILKKNKNSISFISSVNTIHTWTNSGNLSPENAYKKGFIEDSPFNVEPTDFIGILGGEYE